MNPANKVGLNILILYGRMIIATIIGLYSTRLVFNALGSTDYGICNLVASVIIMLSFLNRAMATSSQRYFSFYQGRDDLQKQKEVFTNSFFLHIVIGVIIVAAIEIAGLFLFNGFLNIPVNRVKSAKAVYHYMGIATFFTIISVPFNSLINAHENILWLAIINIIQVFLNLGAALLLYVVLTDKLVVYGMLNAGILLIGFILCAYFCFQKYPECTFKGIIKPKKSFIKRFSSFTGWNLFGALCGIGRQEGLALMLNLFFGVAVNAAYGISNQVSSSLVFFSAAMLSALNPQIMKSEGAGDSERMLRLSIMGSKLGFFLLSIFAVPIIFEMPAILKFWLKEAPPYTIMFCRLVLLRVLVSQLTIGLQSALQAHGDIKLYQAVVGGVLLLNLPLTYLLLKFWNGSLFIVLLSYVFVEFFACILRMYIANLKVNLSYKKYVKTVLVRLVLPLSILVSVDFILITYIDISFRFILTGVLSFFIYALCIYYFGLNDKEKNLLNNAANTLKSKFI